MSFAGLPDARDEFMDRDGVFDAWRAKWEAGGAGCGDDGADQSAGIPRLHRIEQAIQAAVDGDPSRSSSDF